MFLWQQCLPARATMLRYTYIAFFFFSSSSSSSYVFASNATVGSQSINVRTYFKTTESVLVLPGHFIFLTED